MKIGNEKYINLTPIFLNWKSVTLALGTMVAPMWDNFSLINPLEKI